MLDLDETLIHASALNLEDRKPTLQYYSILLEYHNQQGNKIAKDIQITLRPGLQEMLEVLSKDFELILFTAGHEAYMQGVLNFFNVHFK